MIFRKKSKTVELCNRSPVIIVSDIHIGNSLFKKKKEFLHFLRYVDSINANLILNGDIFDFWYKHPQNFSDIEVEIMSRIIDHAADNNVIIIPGNHDFLLTIKQNSIKNVEIVYPYLTFKWNGKEIYVSHGHQEYGIFNDNLLRYTINPIFAMIFSTLHDIEIINKLYNKILKVFTNRNGVDMTNERFYEFASKNKYDVYIFGHTHKAEVRKCYNKIVCNSGDWIDGSDYLLLRTYSSIPKLEEFI